MRCTSKEGGTEAVYLSDGYINLAVLPARRRPEGLHHFGFDVDSIKETAGTGMEAGARRGARECAA